MNRNTTPRTVSRCPHSGFRLGAVLICLALLAFSLTACAPSKSIDTVPDPKGLSGKSTPEAEMLFGKAHVLWKGGESCTDPQKAIELLDQALNIDPEFTEALMWRGMALSQTGRWNAAIEDLTEALRTRPNAMVYAQRGLAFFRTGNYKGSRMDLNRSIALDAGQHRAWNFRGALNLSEGDIPAACADFTRGCKNGDCTGFESAVEAKICQ